MEILTYRIQSAAQKRRKLFTNVQLKHLIYNVANSRVTKQYKMLHKLQAKDVQANEQKRRYIFIRMKRTRNFLHKIFQLFPFFGAGSHIIRAIVSFPRMPLSLSYAHISTMPLFRMGGKYRKISEKFHTQSKKYTMPCQPMPYNIR